MKRVLPKVVILTPINRKKILRDLEACGRVCYKSEDRISAGSAGPFIKSLIARKHLSVIEHVSLRVKFICDRGVTHELVRHRLASYSQESTRYCNYSKLELGFIHPPFKSEVSERWWKHAMAAAEEAYLEMLRCGESAQIARSVLPNSLKTEIIVTANLRQWRHIFSMRTAIAAHPQMRQIMNPLFKEFKAKLPEVFGDMEQEGANPLNVAKVMYGRG